METLYKGAEILPYSDFSDFSFKIFYNEQTKIISARSLKKAGGHIIEYRILMKFLGKKYDRESFSIYDDSQYEYYKSLILIDNEEIDLTPVRLVNTKDDIASPFLLWYQKDFDVAVRYYKIKEREIFLFNGVNLYCNGHYCRSYQVFLIQKINNTSKAYGFYYNGLNPVTFQETYLFKTENTPFPQIFVPKNVDELKSKKDFDIYEIGTDTVIRTNDTSL
ncbi:hypothetical protein [Xanthocytophaga agilis]|uniref:Uncharacterized protein n=1 Tax=Xanthocytophaga agilis TaxID=3048010 RepID=A0AAE3R3G1_9BACT|nr:hypothetical protein [Xanthocytophaga agilis]MDJ1500695.1 hypothetical protein [Xanthocytophaga agilis]